MEYHFAGADDSPEFTFIADGIVDGQGNTIYYHAIKDIKIKRKGNTTLLLITTEENGVKSEHRYSVSNVDTVSLKATIAEMNLTADKKSRPKSFSVWIISVVIVIIIAFCGVAVYRTGKTAEPEPPKIEFKETEVTKRTDTKTNVPDYTISPDREEGYNIVWSSTDESVAKVEYGMLCTGVEGTAQVTAAIDDDTSASIIVHVERREGKVFTKSPYDHSSGRGHSTGSAKPSWTTGGPGAKNSKADSQEYSNALSTAQTCYYSLDMSKKQIYDYLVRSGFPKDAAQYAIDNLY